MSTPRRDDRTGPGGERESGAVLIWTALLMAVLLGFTGWAVDFSHWNRERTRMQKAADAAALAGAVFMPENINGIAFSTAKDIAAKNGYKDGTDGISVRVERGQLPNQLRVTIEETVKNTFAVAIGVGETTLGRDAVGEYQRAVSMGSPINQFGNDPEFSAAPDHGSTRYPDFWTNVFGPSSQKVKGDAIQSTICGSADNCDSSNTDYDKFGYFYAIEVESPRSPLVVQAFDPEFAHVGDNCGDNDGGSGLAAAAALPPNFNPVFAVANPSVRYSPAASSPYCTGDMTYAEGNGVAPWTVYRVRAPDLTPGTPTDNPVLCSIEFPGYTGNLAAALAAPTPQAGAPAPFVEYFRQWYTLCKVNNPQVGTYFLQIETNTKVDGTTAPFGGGANRLALRASLGGDLETNAVQIHGDGRIGIYANSPAANTTFYLARVLPGAPGRALVLNFFDVGDAAQPGAITVQPPPDSNLGSTFAGCTFTPPPGNATGPPWATFTPTASGCRMTNVSNATYNGQWIQLKVPIPNSYTCDYSDPFGCWLRVNFAFPDRVSDTTTWSAQMTGDPVRLTE